MGSIVLSDDRLYTETFGRESPYFVLYLSFTIKIGTETIKSGTITMKPPEQRGTNALFGEQTPLFGNNFDTHLRI